MDKGEKLFNHQSIYVSIFLISILFSLMIGYFDKSKRCQGGLDEGEKLFWARKVADRLRNLQLSPEVTEIK